MKEKDRVKNALEAVAAMNGISVSEVHAEIQNAIQEALENPDPSVQQFWASIPHKGDIPTPEEVIGYLSSRYDSGSILVQ